MQNTAGVSAGELLLYRFKGRALKLCVFLGITMSALALAPATISSDDRGRRIAAVGLVLVCWLLAEHYRKRSTWVPDVLIDRRWVLVVAALTAVPYAIEGHAQSDAFMGLAPLSGVAATTCRRREVIVFAGISVIAYFVGVSLGGGIEALTTADHLVGGIQQTVAIVICCGLSAFVVVGFRRFIERIPPPATVSLKQPGLTKREREVLTLLGEDMNRTEIAKSLFLSNETIKSHIKSARSRLGARNQEEAVSLYWRYYRDDG
jgi:DNA-binding CsgD family transcriptional regulator